MYTELFNELAEGFCRALNLRTVQKYKKALVRVSFPFHWGSFFFYFLLLSAFVPFSRQILEAVNGAKHATSAGATPLAAGNGTTGGWLRASDYRQFWNDEKRLMLGLDTWEQTAPRLLPRPQPRVYANAAL